MITKNLSTLKINKLTQAQYERELAAGNIDEDALYLTPDDENYLPLTGGTLSGDVIITGDYDSKITLGDGYLGLRFGSNRISLSSEEQLIEMQTETDYMNIHRNGVQVNNKGFSFPDQSGTLALTSDLENLSADKITVDHESMNQLVGFPTVQDQLTEIDRILDEDILSKEFALTSDLDAKQDKCINNNFLYVDDDNLIGLDNSTINVGNLDRNLVLETVADRPQWTNDGETYKDLATVDDLENYLPLTGGTLTGSEGYTIGLYPSNEDGQVSEPSIEIANSYGDSADISPAAIDLTYGDNYTYMCAEEGNIGVENSSGSSKMNSDNLQIQSSNDTIISLSAQNGEMSLKYDTDEYISLSPEYIELSYNTRNILLDCETGDIDMVDNDSDSGVHLSTAGILSLQYGDTELYASAEEGYIDFRNGDGNKVVVAPDYMSVCNSNNDASAELDQKELVLRNEDGSATASLSIKNNGELKLHSDDPGYDVSMSTFTGQLLIQKNQTKQLALLCPGALRVGNDSGTLFLHPDDITVNGAKLTFPTSSGTLALTSDVNKKADDYSIEMYNGTSGNPKPVKFISVDYSSCGSENGVAIKLGMVSGHGNGSSYAFLQDVIIKVTHTGTITVDNFKYYGASTGTYEGANRQYGDIFWVHNADTKVVDFYVLMGQYSRVQMTPWKRVTYSTGGFITQYSSATVYSSGTKEWGNNSEFAMMSDISALEARLAALENSVVAVLSGTTEPTSDIGEDDDIYLVTE